MDPGGERQNPRPEQLTGLIDHGLAMVEVRLRATSGARIHGSVKAQLTYLKQVVDAGAAPTDEMLGRLTLSIYAAREFETSDPEFADVLFKIEYLAKRMPRAGGSPTAWTLPV